MADKKEEAKKKKTKKTTTKKSKPQPKKKVAPEKAVPTGRQAKTPKAAPAVKKEAPPKIVEEIKAAQLKPSEPVKSSTPPVEKHKKVKKVVRPKGILYRGTGRRKTAIARVWLCPGKGEFSINGRDLATYSAGRYLLDYKAKLPLVVTNTLSQYDVFAKITGGGVPSQIGALSLGIARALLQLNPDYRKTLKVEGLLTRDPRVKERKKFGRKKARKSFQYSKR